MENKNMSGKKRKHVGNILILWGLFYLLSFFAWLWILALSSVQVGSTTCLMAIGDNSIFNGCGSLDGMIRLIHRPYPYLVVIILIVSFVLFLIGKHDAASKIIFVPLINFAILMLLMGIKTGLIWLQ